ALPIAARSDAAAVCCHHRAGQFGLGAGRHGPPRTGSDPLSPASGPGAARRRLEEGGQGLGKADLGSEGYRAIRACAAGAPAAGSPAAGTALARRPRKISPLPLSRCFIEFI